MKAVLAQADPMLRLPASIIWRAATFDWCLRCSAAEERLTTRSRRRGRGWVLIDDPGPLLIWSARQAMTRPKSLGLLTPSQRSLPFRSSLPPCV